MFFKFLICSLFLVWTVNGLRCFDGTVAGLTNNTQTNKKECGGISNYCIQRINKKNGEMRRECSSWSDEHSMEEKCPMTGCHFVTKDETFCCCQFDECNEWKGDGTEFKAGETVVHKVTASAPKLDDNQNVNFPTAPTRKNAHKFNSGFDADVVIPTTPAPVSRKSSTIELP